jgi:LmbE family N-acetylglucosaminyl deacetylase
MIPGSPAFPGWPVERMRFFLVHRGHRSIADKVDPEGVPPQPAGTAKTMNAGKTMSIAGDEPIISILALPSDAMIVRRPHFQLREGSLFFLISHRPFAVLDQAEQNLWNLLENEASVGVLKARLGNSADEGMRRLLALEVVEVVPPAPLGKRRRVMVIEPHMDDAALSVGGLMLQRRAECEFLIVTIATRSVATSYRGLDREFFDIETVSDLRKAESGIVARLLWGRHIPLGLADATLRYYPQNWTLDWFLRHKPAVNMTLQHAPGPNELEQWTSTLAGAINDLQPEEIWMPLGIGVHTDHQLTRHAFLNILRADPKLVERCVCRFFQDVPYAANYPAHTAAVVKTLGDAGARLEEERVDITAVMAEKMHLLSIYASQWKTEVIQVRVEACAKGLGGPPESYRELWYRVAAAPTEGIDMLATSAVKESVHRVARDLAPWLLRNRSAPVIGLLLTVPVGRWADDMKFLLDYFPGAHFEAHMQAKFAGEAEMFSSDRISIQVGGNRWRWAFGDALRTVVARRQPLVIISGRQMEKKGRWLAHLGLLSDPVVAPTMSDFVLALQNVARHDGLSG